MGGAVGGGAPGGLGGATPGKGVRGGPPKGFGFSKAGAAGFSVMAPGTGAAALSLAGFSDTEAVVEAVVEGWSLTPPPVKSWTSSGAQGEGTLIGVNM